MAVPNKDFTEPGFYIASLQGQTGTFENASSYRRAIVKSGLLRFVTDVSNGNHTDVYSYAYMPCNIVPSYLVTSANYFSSSYTWAWTSPRVGASFIHHVRKSGSSIVENYPIIIARKGYRVRTSSTYSQSAGTWTDGVYRISRKYYYFFTRRTLAESNSSSSTSRVITLNTSGYTVKQGSSTVRSSNWSSGTRYWVGLGLMGGGEAGGNKTGWGSGGAGGTCGGFWFGLINLSAGTWTISMEKFSANNGNADGSDITVSLNGSTQLIVRGGAGGSGSISVHDSSNLITFRSASGVGGGGGGKNGGRQSVSSWSAQTPDQESISFTTLPAGMGANGGGGGGASSILAMGGNGGGHGVFDWNGYSSSEAMGYGSGGGGAPYSMWPWETKNGSRGGYCYAVVGY